MKNRLLYLILIISLVSCTKEIPLNTKDISPILIVNSIICSDSIIKVRVSKSTVVTSNENRAINTAKVSLFENGIFVDTLSNEGNGFYASWKIPVIGEKYDLKVLADGFGEVSANEILCEPAKIIDFSYLANTGYDPVEQMELSDINITFNDDGSRNNYYEIVFYTSSESISKNYYPEYYIRFDNLILNNEGDKDYEPSSIFFSDELFNGKNCNFSIKVGNRYVSPDNKLFAILRTTTYNYYKYRKLWTRHRHNQNQGIDFYQDIFRGEPLEMFTNINNGNGIFAGYSEDVKQAVILE